MTVAPPAAGAADGVEAVSDAGALELEVVGGDAEVGGTLYAETCVPCHGESGQGGHNGIPFSDSLSPEVIFAVVSGGRNDMPAFGGEFNDEQIRALAEYVMAFQPDP